MYFLVMFQMKNKHIVKCVFFALFFNHKLLLIKTHLCNYFLRRQLGVDNNKDEAQQTQNQRQITDFVSTLKELFPLTAAHFCRAITKQ